MTAEPGDATADGSVNFNDLLALAKNYGQTSAQTWETGDFDGDRATSFDDLLVLARHYGSTVAGSFDADWTLAQSLVPEPTTLATLGGLLLMRRRR